MSILSLVLISLERKDVGKALSLQKHFYLSQIAKTFLLNHECLHVLKIHVFLPSLKHPLMAKSYHFPPMILIIASLEWDKKIFATQRPQPQI